MKRKLSSGVLLLLTVFAMACGQKSDSGGFASGPESPATETAAPVDQDTHTDEFTLRDSETNEVLP